MLFFPIAGLPRVLNRSINSIDVQIFTLVTKNLARKNPSFEGIWIDMISTFAL